MQPASLVETNPTIYKIVPAPQFYTYLPSISCQRQIFEQLKNTSKLMWAMSWVLNLLPIAFLLLLSDAMRHMHIWFRSVEWKPDFSFRSWFKLAVIPIADALKRLRRIVSAWQDLQLSSTSAPAAAPRQTLNLQIWYAQSSLLVGCQHKQSPLLKCK